RRALERVAPPPHRAAVARRALARDAVGERLADGRVHLEEVARRRPVRDELVDADDDLRAILDLALIAVALLLDLALHERDSRHRPAQVVDLLDVDARRLLDVAGEALDGEGAAQRIGDRGHSRLV